MEMRTLIFYQLDILGYDDKESCKIAKGFIKQSSQS